mgnify:CR=1 FL=1
MALKKDTDVQEIERDIPRYKSDLEDIDMALYNFLDRRLDIQTSTNKGFRKVPVIWAGAERSQNVKREDILRDKKGNVIYPIIVVERGNINKDLQKKAFPYAAVDPSGDLRGGFMEINRVIKQDKTSNFKKADAFRRVKDENHPLYRGKDDTKVVYETLTIPIPVYVEIDYKIVLRAEYQQQMNDMLTPIVRSTHGHKRVMISHNRNMYEAFIEDTYGTANNISSYETNEKKYESSINIKVLGYLIGDGKNQKQPMVARRENPVQIRFLRERVIVGDIDDEF